MYAGGARLAVLAILLVAASAPALTGSASGRASFVGPAGYFDVYEVAPGYYVALVNFSHFDEVYYDRFYVKYFSSPGEHSKFKSISPLNPVVEDLGRPLGPGELGGVGLYKVNGSEMQCVGGVDIVRGEWWVRAGDGKAYRAPGIVGAARALGVGVVGFSLGSLVVWSNTSGVIDELGTVLLVRAYGAPEALLLNGLGEALKSSIVGECRAVPDVVLVIQETLSPGLVGRVEEMYGRVEDAWDKLRLPLKAVGGLPGFPIVVTINGSKLKVEGYSLDSVITELDKVLPKSVPVLVEVIEYEPGGGTLLPGAPEEGRVPYLTLIAMAIATALVAGVLIWIRRSS